MNDELTKKQERIRRGLEVSFGLAIASAIKKDLSLSDNGGRVSGQPNLVEQMSWYQSHCLRSTKFGNQGQKRDK